MQEKKTFPTHKRRVSNHSDPLFQEDAPLVGSRAILDSPNVIEPDFNIHGLKNKPIPTPSIYNDARGSIINLLLSDNDDSSQNQAPGEQAKVHNKSTGKRLNILRTKRGAMRSGDLHPNKQCSFVFEGSIEVWIPQSDGTTRKFLLGPRDYFEVPAYVPHVENFLDETVHAEWWEADEMTKESSGFRHWYYAPYRRMVDSSFDLGFKHRATLKLLKETKLVGNGDENEETTEGKPGGPSSDRWTLLLAGLICGGLGFALGKTQQARK